MSVNLSTQKEFYRERQKNLKISYRKIYLINKLRTYIENKTVLDLGCGDGLITSMLSFFCDISGADLDVELVKTRFPSIQFENFNLYQNHLTKNYDAILLLDVLEHVPNEMLDTVLTNLVTQAKLFIINLPESPVGEQPIDNTIEPFQIIATFHDLGVEQIFFEKWHATGDEIYNFIVLRAIHNS